MAATIYFEEKIKDLKKDISLDVVLGVSSSYGEGPLMYLNIFDLRLILDEATGRRLAEAMYEVALYLGYARDFPR